MDPIDEHDRKEYQAEELTAEDIKLTQVIKFVLLTAVKYLYLLSYIHIT